MGKKLTEKPAAPAFATNAFAKLAALRDAVPVGQPPAVASRPAAKPAPEGPARAVVRMERTGRGGKEVTIVERLELRTAVLESWLNELKQSLGCGGTLEEGAIVIHGDQRERVRAWLEKRGVKKISVG